MCGGVVDDDAVCSMAMAMTMAIVLALALALALTHSVWRAATVSPQEALSLSTVADGVVGGGAAPLV